MQSLFFERYIPSRPGNQAFVSDFASVHSLSSHDLEVVVELVEAALEIEYEAERKAAIDASLARIEGSRSDARRATGALFFLVRELAADDSRRNTADCLTRDLHELRLVDEGQGESTRQLLALLIERVVPKAMATALRQRTERTILPSLHSFGFATELRLVQKKQYDAHEKIETYEPVIQGVVPIIVASLISSASGDQETAVFQMTVADASKLRDTLTAVVRDAESAVTMLKGRNLSVY